MTESERKKRTDALRRYRASPKGKAATMWTNILARCGSDKHKNRAYKNVEVRMTRDEWMTWAVPEIEKFMGENPGKIPSVDRIEEAEHYQLGNLRIIDFVENSRNSTARIESAFSKITELYGDKPVAVRMMILEGIIDRAREALGL